MLSDARSKECDLAIILQLYLPNQFSVNMELEFWVVSALMPWLNSIFAFWVFDQFSCILCTESAFGLHFFNNLSHNVCVFIIRQCRCWLKDKTTESTSKVIISKLQRTRIVEIQSLLDAKACASKGKQMYPNLFTKYLAYWNEPTISLSTKLLGVESRSLFRADFSTALPEALFKPNHPSQDFQCKVTLKRK